MLRDMFLKVIAQAIWEPIFAFFIGISRGVHRLNKFPEQIETGKIAFWATTLQSQTPLYIASKPSPSWPIKASGANSTSVNETSLKFFPPARFWMGRASLIPLVFLGQL